MRIMWSSVLLLPSLYNAGILAEYCDQPENQSDLTSELDQLPVADTNWTLLAYLRSACGVDEEQHTGSGQSSDCLELDHWGFSYKYWGGGSLKSMFLWLFQL